MKPASFLYLRPADLSEAVELLESFDGEARLLAGGQSLVPMMHMRLMQPEAVIDINGLTELQGIAVVGSETVIGAMTRYSEIEHSAIVAERLRLLHTAVRYVGDRQVRNRGTIGGSLSQADPLGEMALVCLALNAVIVATGPEGDRSIPIEEFIDGPYATALEPNEVLREVRFPLASSYVFTEVGRRHNDYAVVACAVTGSCGPDGTWSGVRIAMIGVDDTAILLEKAAEVVDGTTLGDDAIAEAVRHCREEIDPSTDIRGSEEYRRHLAGVHLTRALRRLRDDEGGRGGS